MIHKKIMSRPTEVVTGCTCDRCGKLVEVDDTMELQEMHHINFTGGYGSIFGDGTQVSCDFCQQCLKDLIEPFLRMCKG